MKTRPQHRPSNHWKIVRRKSPTIGNFAAEIFQSLENSETQSSNPWKSRLHSRHQERRRPAAAKGRVNPPGEPLHEPAQRDASPPSQHPIRPLQNCASVSLHGRAGGPERKDDCERANPDHLDANRVCCTHLAKIWPKMARPPLLICRRAIARAYASRS